MQGLVLRSLALAAVLAAPAAASAAPGPVELAAADPAAGEAPGWSLTLTGTQYLVPDGDDFLAVTAAGDHGRWHLEGRINYEDLDTGSLFLGYRFTAGDSELTFEVTPMLGAVLGATDGLAPAYNLTLAWRSLELYSEGELMLDNDGHAESFFYTWSELGFSPVEWLRFGVVAERTRAYETGLEVQRGVLAGVSVGRLTFTTYVFNLGWEDPTVVLAAAIEF